MLFLATYVYLRENLQICLATQCKSLSKLNLRTLGTTCRSLWPWLNALLLRYLGLKWFVFETQVVKSSCVFFSSLNISPATMLVNSLPAVGLNLVLFNLKLLCLKSNSLVLLAVGSIIYIEYILVYEIMFSWRRDYFGCLNFLDGGGTCHIFHRRIPASLLRTYWRECVFIWQVSSHFKCDTFRTCFFAMECCEYQSLKVNVFSMTLWE